MLFLFWPCQRSLRFFFFSFFFYFFLFVKNYSDKRIISDFVGSFCLVCDFSMNDWLNRNVWGDLFSFKWGRIGGIMTVVLEWFTYHKKRIIQKKVKKKKNWSWKGRTSHSDDINLKPYDSRIVKLKRKINWN